MKEKINYFSMAPKSLPINRYGAIFDAHIHTYYDLHDGKISPTQLIKASIHHGFNWICAMAHDTVRGVYRIRKVAREYNLPVIPAMEISTNFNHLLVYGVQEWKYAKDCWDPEIVIEHLRAQDCAIFVSHPSVNIFRGKWDPEIVARLDVDGIEILNSNILFMNRMVVRNFPHCPLGRRIAGSDAHIIRDFGKAFTQIACTSSDPDDLIVSMKKGLCKPYGRSVSLFSFLLGMGISTKNRYIVPRYKLDNYIIPPDWNLRGLQPQVPLDGKEWRRQLLKKPIRTSWAT
jgi:predicted metal-dependent phosphoesterase TrpH